MASAIFAANGRIGWLRRWAPAGLAAAMALSACVDAPVHSGQSKWSGAGQMVVVTTADWNAGTGVLRSYQRQRGHWIAEGEIVPVVVGRAGSAWGIGLHPAQSGAQKHEGDGRAPAGVFAIGTAFGYAPTEHTALSYLATTATHYCVDVSGSPLYNRIVDTRVVSVAAAAGSTEPMRRDLHVNGDQRYQLGFVIEHNPHGQAQAGSCIFAHVWKSADQGTAGCTAMAEPAMRRLAAWLQARRHPVFVLLPAAEYVRLRTAWDLP